VFAAYHHLSTTVLDDDSPTISQKAHAPVTTVTLCLFNRRTGDYTVRMNNFITLPAHQSGNNTTHLGAYDEPIPYRLAPAETLEIPLSTDLQDVTAPALSELSGAQENASQRIDTTDETPNADDAGFSETLSEKTSHALIPVALEPAPNSLLKQLDPEMWPREKMGREGAGALTNQELLAVLFGRGQRGKDVLTLAGEVVLYLERVTETPSLPELTRIHGIGHGKACQILATLELSRRFLTRNHRARIRKAADALPCLASLRGRRQECFVVITLDGNHQVIRAHEITVGLANQSQVHPRETFACALEDRAVGIMAAHNHPSGSLDPSSEDMAITRRLAEAGRMLGIPLLDHLIVTTEGYTSLRERFPDVFGRQGG
jgi:DNA repair protein RadC